METRGPVDAAEASAALASARRTRTYVAWSGYPVWYWLVTGASLGAMSYAMLLPGWWDAAIAPVIAAVLVGVAYAASRARGICEGWVRTSMTPRDAVVLYGPAVVLILANSVVSRYLAWSSIVAAVLVFVVFAGTGLVLGARARRP